MRFRDYVSMFLAGCLAVPVALLGGYLAILLPDSLYRTAADGAAIQIAMLGSGFLAAYNLPSAFRRLGMGLEDTSVLEIAWRGDKLVVRGFTSADFDLRELQWSFDDGLLLADEDGRLKLTGVILDPFETEQLETALGAACQLAEARFHDQRVPAELRRIQNQTERH